jgi:DNA repair protein RecO (recombination protein O)
MTEIIRSEGIVLRRRDFGETSRVAVVFTQANGKVQLLARGARRPKNKFGAALEPLTRGDFVYYWRETKELFTLSEAAVLASYGGLCEDLGRLPYGFAMAEATERLHAEGDADATSYGALAAALAALDDRGPPQLLLTQLLLRLAAGSGWRVDVGRCATCGRDGFPAGAVFSLAEGVTRCGTCAGTRSETVKLSAPAVQLARTLMTLSPALLTRVAAPPAVEDEILGLLVAHLRYHAGVELKSLAVVPPGGRGGRT